MKKLCSVLLMIALLIMTVGGQLSAVEDPNSGTLSGGGNDGAHPWGGDGITGDDDEGEDSPMDSKPAGSDYPGFTTTGIMFIDYFLISFASAHQKWVVLENSYSNNRAATKQEMVARFERNDLSKKRTVR